MKTSLHFTDCVHLLGSLGEHDIAPSDLQSLLSLDCSLYTCYNEMTLVIIIRSKELQPHIMQTEYHKSLTTHCLYQTNDHTTG